MMSYYSDDSDQMIGRVIHRRNDSNRDDSTNIMNQGNVDDNSYKDGSDQMIDWVVYTKRYQQGR